MMSIIKFMHSVIGIALAIWLFMPGVAAEEQCSIDTSPMYGPDEPEKRTYEVSISMGSSEVRNRPVLVYCGDGSYPKVTRCYDRERQEGGNQCFTTCSYTQKGTHEVRVVEKPSRVGRNPQTCTELCSTQIEELGDKESHNQSEGYRLMDSCNSKVFVANGGNDSLTVIDAESDTVIDSIPVGEDPRGVKCNTQTNEVWVTNWGSGSIDIIDADSLTKKAQSDSIDACINPWGIDFTNDGEHAFVACWGGTQDMWCSEFEEASAQTAVSQAFSEQSNTMNARQAAQQSENLPAVLRDYDSRRKGPGSVEVFDANTHVHEKTLQVDSSVNGGPWGTEGCGQYMFVTNDGTDTASVFDQETFEKKGTIDVGEVPWDASCNEITNKLYVANGGANNQQQKRFWHNREGQASVSVIDANDLKEERRIPTGYGKNAEPWTPAVNEQTGKVYVADTFQQEGSIHALQAQMAADGDVTSVAIAEKGKRSWDGGKHARGVVVANGKVYVANTGGGSNISTKGEAYGYGSEQQADGSVAVLDAQTLELEKEINQVPGTPDENESKPGTPEEQTATVSFERGWNLLSIPHGKLSVQRLQKACGIQSVFGLSGEGSGYTEVSAVFSTYGYWVYAETTCDTNVSVTSTEPSQLLQSDWNLISAAQSWDTIRNNCQMTSDGLYWYDTQEQRYKQINANTALEPHRGYWVQVQESCTLSS